MSKHPQVWCTCICLFVHVHDRQLELEKETAAVLIVKNLHLTVMVATVLEG